MKKRNKTTDEIIRDIREFGFIEILPGVHIESRESITSNQKEWGDEDESKGHDFSGSPFWITSDDGQAPQGITAKGIGQMDIRIKVLALN